MYKTAIVTAALFLTFLFNCAKTAKSPKETEVGISKAPTPPDNFRTIDDTKFKAYKHGIFEVVVPWDMPSKVTYEEALPYEKLPYHLRKNPYVSIGTAFAITSKMIVSAAHVFDAHKISHFTNQVKLRGADGKIYEIDKVTRYSQHRDLIGITLKSYPKNLKPLQASKKTSIGQMIFAVGNALGEGIVVRDGRIASFTPEEVNGEWKFIRFTAPASPGNSGGALLDAKGKVIGVVVRRSENENLNYAVPIEEFIKLPTTQATFYDNSYKEVEAGKSLHTPWKGSIPLPQSLKSFQVSAHKAFMGSFVTRRKAFEKKYSKYIYPNHPKLEAWAPSQSTHLTFLELAPDANGNWKSKYHETKKSKIGAKQELAAGYCEEHKMFELYIEKKPEVSLKEFYSNPNYTMQAFLKGVDFKRPFASEEIRVKSLGKPAESDLWVDKQGRTWIYNLWAVQFLDSYLRSDCLPTPQGLACRMQFVELWQKPLRDLYKTQYSNHVALSYAGKLKDWQEFLALPQKYLPKFLQENAQLKLSKAALAYRFGGLVGNLKDPALSSSSILQMGVIYDPENVAQFKISKIVTKPQAHKANTYVSEYLYKPSSDAEDEAHDQWKDILAKRAPFNGKTQRSSEGHQTIFIANNNSGRGPASQRKSFLLAESCHHDSSVEKGVSQKLCSRFRADNQRLRGL